MKDRLALKRVAASALLAASCTVVPIVSASQSSGENTRQQNCSDFHGEGEVNNRGVTLRYGPGTSYGEETYYQTGNQVNVNGGVFGENVNGDSCWLSVTGQDGRAGYILSEYVTLGASGGGGDLGIIQTTEQQTLPAEYYSTRVLCDKTGISSPNQIFDVILQSDPTRDYMSPDYSAYSTSHDLGADAEAVNMLFNLTGRNTWRGYGWYNPWGYEGVDYRVESPTYANRIIIRNNGGVGDTYLLFELPGYLDGNGYGHIYPLDPNAEAYIWVFTTDRLNDPFTDSNGQHYGVHPPCTSIAILQGEIMPLLQVMN